MIFVKNRVIVDKKLSNNGYLVYIGMSMLLRQNEISYYVNSDSIAYLLSQRYPIEANLKSNIVNGIAELADKKLISIEDKNISKHEWIINSDLLIKDVAMNNDKTLPENFYTTIDKEGIRKIMSSSKQYYTKSISIVRFYSYLLSTIHNKDDGYKGVGFTSITEMSNNIGYNKKTISEYIKYLCDIKLIYVYKSKDFIKFENGDIVEISHTYGRYNDKEEIERMGLQHEEKYGEKLKASHKKVSKKNTNNTRKYSQMYNHIFNCLLEGKDINYSYKEIKEVYFAIRELNKIYKTSRKERIKDLSIFQNYDFYIED